MTIPKHPENQTCTPMVAKAAVKAGPDRMWCRTRDVSPSGAEKQHHRSLWQNHSLCGGISGNDWAATPWKGGFKTNQNNTKVIRLLTPSILYYQTELKYHGNSSEGKPTNRYSYLKVPATFKIFRINPHKPTTYFMLFLRDEEPLAQKGKETRLGSQSQDSSPCLAWSFQGQWGGLLRDGRKK